MSYEGPRSTDPEALGQVAAPVLLLRGEQTLLCTFFADVARYLAHHVVDAHVRELPGVGHFAPLLEPELIAKELISFFVGPIFDAYRLGRSVSDHDSRGRQLPLSPDPPMKWAG
jgi:hypothetical protein